MSNDVYFYGSSTDASGTVVSTQVLFSSSTPAHVDLFVTNALLICVVAFLGIDLLRRVFGSHSLR